MELLDTLRRYADELSATTGIEVPYRALVVSALVEFFESLDVPIEPGYRSGRL